jgi:pyruvate, water dikinase
MIYCRWLHEYSAKEGTEIHALQTLERAGLPVPISFVVTEEFLEEFFQAKSQRSKMDPILEHLDMKEANRVGVAAGQIRKLIHSAKFSQDFKEELGQVVQELHTRLLRKQGTALRVTCRVLIDGSTELVGELRNTQDAERFLKQVVSLLCTERDMVLRLSMGVNPLPPVVPLLIQCIEEADVVSQVYAHDPDQHDDTTLVIRAWPYSQPVHQQELTDIYRVDRKTGVLLSRAIQKRWWAKRGSEMVAAPETGMQGLLTDEHIATITRLVGQADGALQGSLAYTVVRTLQGFQIGQVQQLHTTLPCSCFQPGSVAQEELQAIQTVVKPLFQGKPGVFGTACGPVRIVKRVKEKSLVQPGEIVVIEKLSPGILKGEQHAAAYIVESALVPVDIQRLQHLQIPTVYGVGSALSELKTGQVVTVDGYHGEIWPGIRTQSSQQASTRNLLPVIGTKLLSIITDPHSSIAKEVDGIGILRGEFIIRLLRLHPHDVLRANRAEEYSEVLQEGLLKAAQALTPKPVLYHLHDASSFHLLGMRPQQHERHEPNPTMGYRGAHRILSEPELLQLELSVLVGLVKRGVKNLSILLPMVRQAKEVEKFIGILQKKQYLELADMPVWIKCETPGLLVRIEEICALPVEGVVFEVTQITQLMQGIDRENRQVGHHLETADRAVQDALHYAISTCRHHGISTMIVSEEERLHPAIVQTAIQAGVTSVAAHQTDLTQMRDLVAASEQRMILDHLISEEV